MAENNIDQKIQSVVGETIEEAIQKVGSEQGYDFILDAVSGGLVLCKLYVTLCLPRRRGR